MKLPSHLRVFVIIVSVITTTISMLFGDNSEGAGSAHSSSFCLFNGSRLV